MCPHLSVMATRHEVQQRFRVKNTCCETCLIDCVICCDCMMCCFSEESAAHHLLHCITHAVMCCAMPCMQAQAHHQFKMETKHSAQKMGGVDAPYVMIRT